MLTIRLTGILGSCFIFRALYWSSITLEKQTTTYKSGIIATVVKVKFVYPIRFFSSVRNLILCANNLKLH